MQISDFDYELPEELVAQHPLLERDASRMLVVDREHQTQTDEQFASLPKYLRAGDCLVLNNTKVFPARLMGERVPSGGTTEVLLLREVEPNLWQVLARPARRLRIGARISFGNGRLQATVTAANEDGTRLIQFEPRDDFLNLIAEVGQPPLPPYIRREGAVDAEDRERYQTVYARESGAIAAPTAGLHFTPKVLDEIKNAGVSIAEITLHVGYGTFEPVRVEEVSEHRVLPEMFSITAEAAEIINRARASGGRIIAVGTTTTRALESAVSVDGEITPGSSTADLTITPGYEFRMVDALVTNFHLPRSSLLLLVSAFAGREPALAAYRHAVSERYRFYSYGDCMLII
ncbi:MAG TPA: tRNA preQ1(34) S-adenosylmethionine ribosyltransferase-isomerase QueA [Pyrinomonadaceae bacterium]|nr:tRNA preQ1(34) S-adenosylmethionine ribosyltransferase-isomerase QueA [Pyrinomonadaceae bacterium]